MERGTGTGTGTSYPFAISRNTKSGMNQTAIAASNVIPCIGPKDQYARSSSA